MLAVQFKSSLVVVEFDSLPVVKSMAPLAIGDALLIKLLTVNVFMTGRTRRRQIPEFLIALGEPSALVVPMAGHAWLPGMRALKFELCLVMIKMIVRPGRSNVAPFAGQVGVKFWINKSLMHILVTVCTFFTDVPELPFFLRLLFVARKTRGGGMAAVQREFGLGMVGNGEHTAGEAVYRMALATIRA